MKKVTPAKVVKRVVGGIMTVVVVIVIVLAAALAIGRATGRYDVVPVLSGSMKPTFDPGDAVITTPLPPDQVRVGQIIEFQPPSTIGDGDSEHVLHRIVGIKTDGVTKFLVTKGDANNTIDKWRIPVDNTLRREVLVIPQVGNALVGLTKPVIRLGFVVLAGLIAIWAVLWWWRSGYDYSDPDEDSEDEDSATDVEDDSSDDSSATEPELVAATIIPPGNSTGAAVSSLAGSSAPDTPDPGPAPVTHDVPPLVSDSGVTGPEITAGADSPPSSAPRNISSGMPETPSP